MLRSELAYGQQLLKMNHPPAFQGVLDNCQDVGITKIEFQEAQAPLKPSIRRPTRDE